MDKVIPMTYFYATSFLPFICRTLLQTISEDICFHIATYLPRYDGSKLLAAYVLYNKLKFNNLLYIRPSYIHLLGRKKKIFFLNDIIYTGRVTVSSAPKPSYKLSSHRKHFSTRTKSPQKQLKRRMNKLQTKGREFGRIEKYNQQSILNPADGRPLSGPYVDHIDHIDYVDYVDHDLYDFDYTWSDKYDYDDYDDYDDYSNYYDVY